ncbi:hypothetical protein K3152_01750 [Qipengyuania sp. 1NDH17]|uniref:Uncharacterized protein n=1 Tax=Qipengyuania polymorpha TaxID=2867234 RepID=A0ABS7IVP9_9SPHN|nr:hypothetical protein [Qipengyuania polymorpha]MBX7456959.1 hypothetical protein [Qipengyuania polymorpha]
MNSGRFTPLPVAQQRPANAVNRRCLRLLGMLHELHKVGYQRLRADMGMSPSGIHWRCTIFVDGPGDIEPAYYTSADNAQYFRWMDAEHDTARQMAAKFIDRFPDLCAAGAGLDYANAGWLTWMLGKAESGDLPVFYADYPIDIDPQDRPPPPSAD